LLAPRPTLKLEDHPSSAVRDCLFNLYAATLLIGGRSSIRNLRTRLTVATHSIRQIPLHFHSRALPCAIEFQLDSTLTGYRFSVSPHGRSFYSHCCNELHSAYSSGAVTASCLAALHKVTATDTQTATELSRMFSHEAP